MMVIRTLLPSFLEANEEVMGSPDIITATLNTVFTVMMFMGCLVITFGIFHFVKSITEC